MIKKTIRIHSEKLTRTEIIMLRVLYKKCKRCKNDFYQMFSGIKSLDKIQNYISLRNDLRKINNNKKENGYLSLEEKYCFINKLWVMLLFDVCSNIKSCWSNLANILKTMVRENDNIASNEKSYLYYILSSPSLWFSILNRKDFKEPKKLKDLNVFDERKHYLFNYIRRITRKKKFQIPKANELKCMTYTEELYTIIDNKDLKTSSIKFSTDVKSKRMKIRLKSRYCYRKNGNIQLIFNEGKKRLEIHKLIYTKPKSLNALKLAYHELSRGERYSKNAPTSGESSYTVKRSFTLNAIGVDKGYHDLLSCSDGNEYGKAIGELFTRYSNFINERCKNKQKSGYEKKSETFNKQMERKQAFLEQQINMAIKEMINTSNPSMIVKEDLSFTKDKSKASKGAKFNRNMSNWLKGFLDERLEYIAGTYGIEVEDVNPAYTSKFCTECGAKLIKRKGRHSEIGICPNCGELNANVNAAKNILNRYDDKEITLYTPYKNIDKILLNRYNKNKQ